LARSLRLLLEIGVRTLAEDSVPSELARRVTGHLGCELSAVVSVAERFPIWEHVNIQRGIDAYLAAQHNDAEWFAAPGAGQRPRENMLSLISTPGHFSGVRVTGPRGIAVAGIAGGTGEAGTGAASYGTVAIGPEENTEVVTLGLVTATAPDGAPRYRLDYQCHRHCHQRMVFCNRSAAPWPGLPGPSSGRNRQRLGPAPLAAGPGNLSVFADGLVFYLDRVAHHFG
jgi:hypothetical protein